MTEGNKLKTVRFNSAFRKSNNKCSRIPNYSRLIRMKKKLYQSNNFSCEKFFSKKEKAQDQKKQLKQQQALIKRFSNDLRHKL